ncbi:tagatose 1,6-diphosphate aldolase [Enterococcus sp. DIV0876]|uniref:tagatose 1,6-diphosphate aldolase n=1 Tax=Enterococcus sp. DIV0876 TaxID=2774633 RepID=UPI003D2FB58D
MKRISRGKFEKMQKLANDDGVIAALAIDQRGSMKKMMKAATGPDNFTMDHIYEFKKLVSQELTKYVSGILLDEEYGFLGIEAKNPQAGLILSYEKTGYDVHTPGRLPEILPNESLQRLVKKGADAAKVLVYYNPDESQEILDIKHAFLERLGTEAQAADIPLFVEPIVYDDEITDALSPAFAKIKPSKVIRTIQELTKDQYHIDILKVEVPVQFNLVEGFQKDGLAAVYTQEEAANYFKEASEAATRPFIYLSAGVPANVFRDELIFAGQHGAKFSGILGGRATWRDSVDIYGKQGADALVQWLDTQGKENVEELNAILKQYATPWYECYGGLDNIEVFDLDVMA